MSLKLCVKFETRDPYISSHQYKYSSHSHGCLRENRKGVWDEVNRRLRTKPGKHLTGGRERKSTEGNLSHLVRNKKTFFSLLS